jgi:beta-phosphoglucomutase-like phosphatase (HAD superfamily)
VRDTDIQAVVFDMDGVLIESEGLWDRVREELTAEHGGAWSEHAHRDMMGMSSLEWPVYMRDVLGLDLTPGQISDEVVARLAAGYRAQLPLISGADDAVRRLAEVFTLGVASSSNLELIELVLSLAGLRELFAVVLSSEQVPRGKPAPDVYVEAVEQLGLTPPQCTAIEDSTAGLTAARAAGVRVVAIPNRHYPPAAAALATADVVISDISRLTVEVVAGH